MTPEEKLQLDLRDFWRIHDGLEAYVKLDAKGMMERLKAHKEDAFCEVTDYARTGKLMCTRDGYDAIHALAERHRDSMPVPDDYSVKELVGGIRSHIVRVIVDEKQDEPALARVLAQAVADADKNHIERTYHFPSVVVPYDEPPQFRIGVVGFTAAKSFRQAMATEIQQYVERSSDQAHATDRVARFEEYIAHLGWVASVTIPACAEESARCRAEVAVTTAINLLRLVFGVDYGRDMRLAHSAHVQPLHTEHAVSQNGKLHFVWSRKGSGALVEKNWYLLMDKWEAFWQGAAHLISTTVVGKRSEVAERVIDALTWFGDAAFESAPGVQIVNFVAALERLTTTELFQAHKFCSRVALLAFEDDSTFEKTYWDAYTIYTARSGVIHGGFSPNSPTFLKTLRLAHDVTRNALFRALEVHCLLDDPGKLSNLADLQNFFDRQQSKRAAVLSRLGDELKRRIKEAKKNIGRRKLG
jgi:hypothetical protein